MSVGALTYRAYTRNIQVITSNQQRVIYNAATPAIDRARSKLEFMFDSSQDKRYPTGNVPEEKRLASMMRNDGLDDDNKPFAAVTVSSSDSTSPYLLPDETAIELAGTTVKDNAWSYRADTDGDGSVDATVVYSIIFRTPINADPAESQRSLVTLNDKKKAQDGVVRHGPLTTETGSACQLPPSAAANTTTSVGWFNDPTNTSVVRKNFQVDVLVVPDSAKSAATTIEFHQDREISKGNKWGAWFRNDLEVFPGPAFRFNGAMHTEGSLIVGGTNGETGSFQSYLISSKNSCLYPPIDNSEISITTGTEDDKFKGLITAGTMGNKDAAGGFVPHYQEGGQPKYDITIDSEQDTTIGAPSPEKVYSDPVAILTEDKRQTVETPTGPTANPRNNSSNYIAPAYDANLQRRIQFKKEPTPYIDDLSRADKRWGPKSTYPSLSAAQALTKVPDRNDGAKTGYGYAIPIGNDSLTKENTSIPDASAKDLTDEGVGADGYWEARARNEGLRILVGERLELGNPFGWVTPRDLPISGVPGTPGDTYISSNPTTGEREGDPLYPPEIAPYSVGSSTARITHLQQQRRTLRDNLAAVQATALYHTDFINQGLGRDYPFACLATTAHPGTPTTLRQSTNFVPTRFNTSATEKVDLLSDFFLGRGTNGWEFEPPAGNLGAFTTAIGPTKPLGIALRNLANFAGDPAGAFPAKQDDVMHPYPALSMWGNFSNLRRALDLMDNGTGGYEALSIADKTYIQTASCTVGMLAYEIDTVQKFDPTNPNNNIDVGLGLTSTAGKLMFQLGTELYNLMDESSNTTGTDRVLPKALTRQFQYTSGGTNNSTKRNPRDYYNVPPEAYIEALRQQYTERTGNGYGVQAVNNSKLRMAELIMLNFQIRRDRTFGFRPSPSFGHYAIRLTSDTELAVYPSACDPDMFAIDDDKVSAESRPMTEFSPLVNPPTPAPQSPPPTVPTNTNTSASGPELLKARLGLSRLCGALNIPDKASYDLADAAKPYSISISSQARPVVMPKFPALYYIFPERTHGLAGDKSVDGGVDSTIPDVKGEYDTRQPGTPEVNAFPLNSSALKFLGLTKDDKESYVIDPYVNRSSVAGSYQFLPVQSGTTNEKYQASPSFDSSFVTTPLPLSYPNSVTIPTTTLARFPDQKRQVFPMPDLMVNSVAIKPRNLPGFTLNNSSDTWRLPSSLSVAGTSDNANVPTNIIQAPSGTTSLVHTPVAVPFLDRAFFDGRQLMLARTLDLDLGMMRSDKTKLAGGQRGEPLLPMSGIVYAFREDSVREDAIARPAGTTPYTMAIDPKFPLDPALTVSTAKVTAGISTKSVDNVPDPSRRIHGFRLRNGRQVKRDKGYESIGTFKPADNYRGLSFVTDQPLYIQGDLNRHQTGNDDTNGTALEEFTTRIRGTGFNENTFYNRATKDNNFASLANDRWRPTELLADSISILSDNFCDGSISDMFVSYDTDADKGYQRHPNTTLLKDSSLRSVYHDGPSFATTGLYGLGCTTNSGTGNTSFKNSDRPNTQLDITVTNKTGRYDWLRENPNLTSYNDTVANSYEPNAKTMPAGDYATPIKISRSGLPLVNQPSGLSSYNSGAIDQKLSAVGTTYAYGDTESPIASLKQTSSQLRFGSIQQTDGQRMLINASPQNINAIVVSGIVPSQPGNSYGGMHNLPRFIENWGGGKILDYAGSFLQLSFSNYATAPFRMVGWEYNSSGVQIPISDANTNTNYYSAPERLWGYDVALQLAPAGPAASRFVVSKTPRNEFYSEPQINDPYIQNLCAAARADLTRFPGAANLNCTN